jgi:hypothetical protein
MLRLCLHQNCSLGQLLGFRAISNSDDDNGSWIHKHSEQKDQQEESDDEEYCALNLAALRQYDAKSNKRARVEFLSPSRQPPPLQATGK